jgi:hypothetical protein
MNKNTQKKKPVVFAKEVWDTLSAVDVSGLTEEKGKFTYLSWASAWAILMELYPESYFEPLENEYFPDGTMSVTMRVTVKRGAEQLSHAMYLQVLNHTNNAVESPNAHQINNTRMRCLVKALGLFGLACHIYQGQDVPTIEDVEVAVKIPRQPHEVMLERYHLKMDEAKTKGLLKTHYEAAYTYFRKWNEKDTCDALFKKYKALDSTFESGTQVDKTKEKKAA